MKYQAVVRKVNSLYIKDPCVTEGLTIKSALKKAEQRLYEFSAVITYAEIDVYSYKKVKNKSGKLELQKRFVGKYFLPRKVPQRH